MRKFIIPLILTALLLPINISADPGTPDTVRIGSVSGLPGEIITVPVFLYNDEPLSAVEFVFVFDAEYLSIDTFSLEGGRLEYIPDAQIIYRDSAGILNLNIMDWFGWMPRGDGFICNLFFKVSSSAPSQTYMIDSTHWGFSKTIFADSASTGAIFPQFVPGYITVLEPPPTPDSVWVENITGQPGQTVDINIYAYNENPLDTIQLALEYSSGSISFEEAIFDGTRGDSAQSKITYANSSLRQVLVALAYSQDSPLTPGTGPLATLRFVIDSSASVETVHIDSGAYLGVQSLEFSFVNNFGGGITFTPFFTPGDLTITTSTDVGDEIDPLLPKEFVLKQNHPNPFNPLTMIEFDLPKASYTTLSVFNILGQRVTTLVDRFLSAGRHQITFDGRNENKEILASGVYFYRLETEDFCQSRKMTLMK